MPEARRQRRQNESGVNIRDVVSNDQQRSGSAAQVPATDNPRPAQQKNRRTQKQVMCQQPYPGDRPTQRPTGIVISRSRRDFSAQHAFQIGNGAHCAEPGFAQIDLITILQRAHQFHAI